MNFPLPITSQKIIETKDILTLTISFIALGISLYNFYSQQFRRRDKVIGHLIESGTDDGDFDRYQEYSIANVGDTQVLIREADIFISPSLSAGHAVTPECLCETVPAVLKPGDITVFRVLYKSISLKENFSKGDICYTEFGIFTPNGVEYRLPHIFKGEGATHESIWKVFKLTKKHSQQ